MSSSGIVTVKDVGRQKHYQSNPECPIYAEMVALVRKTVGMVDPIREALLPFADSIRLALIFGSVARGAEHAGSDVDLLVVADTLTLESLYEVLEPVERSPDRTIDPTLYGIQEFAKRRAIGNPFLTRVLRGETVVLFGEINAAT